MIRIIVVDEQTIVRESIAKTLATFNQVQVVGQASSGEEALLLVREKNPDIVVTEVVMSGIGGLEATRRIVNHSKFIGVIALTSYVQAPFPTQMLKAGALGYLSKQASSIELEKAIRRVFMGKRYVCQHVAQQLADHALQESEDNPFESLSHREMQIMMMVVNCQKVREISGTLHLSPKTVNSYRYRIFEKLQVQSDVELVLLAVQHGIIRSKAFPLRAGYHDSPGSRNEFQEDICAIANQKGQ